MGRRHPLRTVWLSDIHLGSRACQAEALLAFLRMNECERLYLVGDVIDLVQLRRSVYWPPVHTEVLRQILLMSRNGTRVTLIPGNHDDELRKFCGLHFGNLDIALRAIHTTADGRRLLVLHGDEFDGMLGTGHMGARAGALAYGLLLSGNRLIHRIREFLGLPYWSLAQHVKSRIGRAVDHVARFRRACLEAARETGADGVVCGHIHVAEIGHYDGLVYANDGDWVESCTAIVEDEHGELAITSWHELPDEVSANPVAIRDAA